MHGERMKFGHNGTCIYNNRDFKAKTGGSRNLGLSIVKIERESPYFFFYYRVSTTHCIVRTTFYLVYVHVRAILVF